PPPLPAPPHSYQPRSHLISRLLRRPRPRSTLFPYTTLFRSCWKTTPRSAPGAATASPSTATCPAVGATKPATALSTVVLPQPDGDRKSTRLNSSHVAISYAVFCLKKETDPRLLKAPEPLDLA